MNEPTLKEVYDACDQVCKAIKNIETEPGLITTKMLLIQAVNNAKRILNSLEKK